MLQTSVPAELYLIEATEQASKTGPFELSSPRSERGEDQGEGRFGLPTYGLVSANTNNMGMHGLLDVPRKRPCHGISRIR